jgi:hypothetical protein
MLALSDNSEHMLIATGGFDEAEANERRGGIDTQSGRRTQVFARR